MSSVLSDSIEMRKAAREHYSTFKVTQRLIQLNFMRKLLNSSNRELRDSRVLYNCLFSVKI